MRRLHNHSKNCKTVLITVVLALFCAVAIGCMPSARVSEIGTIASVYSASSEDFGVNIATFNLYGAGMNKEKSDRISEHFNEMAFDAVGLQEIDRNLERSGNLDYLSQLTLGDYTAGYFAPAYALGENYGIGMITRKKISVKENYFLPYHRTKIDPSVEQRVVTRCVVDCGTFSFTLYNTHLTYEPATVNGVLLRIKQIEFLVALLNADPNPYKILTGDFNISSLSELSALNAANMTPVFLDGVSTLSDGLIDNILYSDDLALVSTGRKDLGTSDHYLLHAKFIKKA